MVHVKVAEDENVPVGHGTHVIGLLLFWELVTLSLSAGGGGGGTETPLRHKS